MKYTLGTEGQVCPFPLVEAKQAMEQIELGDELIINFDCTQGTEAIPRWAAAISRTATSFGAPPSSMAFAKIGLTTS